MTPDYKPCEVLLKNLLWSEKSPYLLQHASNPVHWMPWGEEAFSRAKKENKPLFVSIGYATCHWCHVMEKESFEDLEIAALLNEYFVSIKVDREERPDIDSAMMTVCQMLNGHGGWPLTLALTPDKEPFFAATYIAKYTRGQNRPGLLDLLPILQETFQQNPERILEITSKIKENAIRIHNPMPAEVPLRYFDSACAQHLIDTYDTVYGGFGSAPKFPTPQNLLFLLDYGEQKKDQASFKMARTTLKWMRYGGMYDQIGYGFHRYSTDRAWKVPHFEKMLYDQAFLLLAYSKAFAHLQRRLTKHTALEIAAYVARELTSAEGLFYSAIDADSEGEEGKFYTWAQSEIRSHFSVTESALIEEIFDIRPEGNYLEEQTGYPNGTNVLYLSDGINSFSEKLGMNKEDFQILLEELREKMLTIRSQRTRPLTDDKILTDWNGYMIYALAMASLYLDEEKLLKSAERTWNSLEFVMTGPDGLVYHRYREQERAIEGFACDVVALSLAALGLYEAGQDPVYLQRAVYYLDLAEAKFLDKNIGGLFMTSEDQETPLGRQKESIDSAIPSLNSIYGWICYRLFRLTGELRYRESWDQTLRLAAVYAEKSPGVAPFLARTHTLHQGVEIDIVLSGQEDDPVLFQMREVCRSFAYTEQTVHVLTPSTETQLRQLSPFIRQMQIDATAKAYLCVHHHCELPVTSAEELYQQLSTSVMQTPS